MIRVKAVSTGQTINSSFPLVIDIKCLQESLAGACKCFVDFAKSLENVHSESALLTRFNLLSRSSGQF